jgi:hypothetical protein
MGDIDVEAKAAVLNGHDQTASKHAVATDNQDTETTSHATHMT